MFEFVKNYRNNDRLRASFNELTEKTFGLNFEGWYQNGFWTDNYEPYSIVENGKVIANVSVNRTNMVWNGQKRRFIQLGTVMTEENYRNQGLIRRIMKEIEKDYADVDGMYLFGNDNVVQFYPKFGFRPSIETEYFKEVVNAEDATIEQVSMKTAEEWKAFQDAVNRHQVFSSFDMVENSELYMFYVSQFMQENVYYDSKSKAYVIAEIEGADLFIHAVISEKAVSLDDVIKAFGKEIKFVTLGFTPLDKKEFKSREHKEEDCTLFLKGKVFDLFEKEKCMFQTLSHA